MKLFPKRPKSNPQSGIILPAVASMLAILGVLLISLLGGSVDQKQWSDNQEYDSRVESIADTAIALAANRIWMGFENSAGPEGMNPWNFRAYLSGLGVMDQSLAINPTPDDILAVSGLSQDGVGNYPMSGGYVVSLGVTRLDSFTGTRMTISARASMTPGTTHGRSNNQATVQQTFEVDRPQWEGLDFALLANNVNCLLCHADIDDAERFYNQEPGIRGEFDRVRVGSLESIHIRSNPDSRIAGALYLGGNALKSNGDQLTDWAGLSLESAQFGVDRKLLEDPFGGLNYANFQPADAVDPIAGENLYQDYLANGTEGQVDGALPDYFPAPFPDNGGYDIATGTATPELGDNRILDDNEFMAATTSAVGSLSGGRIAVIPPGNQVSSLAQLDTALDAGLVGIGGVTTGNVILHGTKTNPIILDGSIAVDGDLVISGYVKGEGSLMASGNVFVPGDLLYDDGADINGARTYGTSNDGTKNALGLTAGGTLTFGDPSHPKSGSSTPVDGTPSTGFNFLMDELAIFNRGEWLKTQPTLPGEGSWDKKITEVEVLVTPTRDETYFEDVDVFGWQATGAMITQNTYGWVQTGTRMVDDYDYVVHPADPPEPYGSPWTEAIWTGSHEEPVMAWQVTGTREVPEMVYTYLRTDSVERTRQIPDGDPYYETRSVEESEWVVNTFPNPMYAGPDYIARFYAFSETAPVPIFNKDGYFDPADGLWHSPERAKDWTSGRLSVADQADPTDPFLFNTDGTRKAVVETVAPKSDWMTGEVLAQLVDREVAGRDETKPLELDATIYSANSIFGMVPSRNQPGLSGKLLVNGALIAADIGVLAGKGLRINYDKRNSDLIQIADDRRLTIRRSLWAPSARP